MFYANLPLGVFAALFCVALFFLLDKKVCNVVTEAKGTTDEVMLEKLAQINHYKQILKIKVPEKYNPVESVHGQHYGSFHNRVPSDLGRSPRGVPD